MIPQQIARLQGGVESFQLIGAQEHDTVIRYVLQELRNQKKAI